MTKMLLFLILQTTLILPPLFSQASAGFTKVANVSQTTYTDTTCPDSGTCFYQITALDVANHESIPFLCAANALCFNGNQAVGVIPPSGTHTATVTWTASTTTGVSYNVYRAVGPTPGSGVSVAVN